MEYVSENILKNKRQKNTVGTSQNVEICIFSKSIELKEHKKRLSRGL